MLIALLCATLAAPTPSPIGLVERIDTCGDGLTTPMDGGRHFLAGQKNVHGPPMDRGQDELVLTFFAFASKRTTEVTLAMQPLIDRAADLFIDGVAFRPNKNNSRNFSTFEVDVVGYRPAQQSVYLVIQNRSFNPDKSWRERFLWVRVNSETSKVAAWKILKELSGPAEERFNVNVKSFGPLPDDAHHLLWYARRTLVPGRADLMGAEIELWKIAVATGEIVWNHPFKIPPNTNKDLTGFSTGHNVDFSALVLAEYSELANEPMDPRPQVHVIWPASNRHLRLETPHAPYGIVVDRAGKTLVIASSQDGTLWKYDLTGERKVSEHKSFKRSHQAVLTPDESLLIILPSGRRAEVWDFPALDKKRKLVAKKVLGPDQEAFCGGSLAQTSDPKTLLMTLCDPQNFEEKEGGGLMLLSIGP